MESLEKIGIGVLLFALTSVLAYLFRMRQLYVVIPKLFRHARISQNGSLCEIIIYNRGNQTEEAIRIEFDPSLKLELLASGSTDLALSGSTLAIDRLQKRTDASAILLVENGVLDPPKLVAVSSKATTGRVCKAVSDVPPNFALMFLAFLAIAGMFPAIAFLPDVSGSVYGQYAHYRLRDAPIEGWHGIGNYYSSDLRPSYSRQEFPVQYRGLKKDANRSTVKFEVLNKTAVPLTVYVDSKDAGPKIGSPYFASVEVPPMSKTELSSLVPPPDAKTGTARLDFSFKWGSEFIHKMEFHVPKN